MRRLVYRKLERAKGKPVRRPRTRLHITKGDTVVVISGEEKGKRGKVLRALPQKGRVVVEGVNIVKRHRRARQQGEESQIVEFAAPIAASKVMLIDPKDDRPTRVRRRIDKDGTVERVSVRSGEPIPRSR
ncbi:MAG TPA: 50S ribosomal protein L24 [Candidatus Binatia bacterium]|nr:50S ribosomal protein L24 [Candidatus Binatia bacterium]